MAWLFPPGTIFAYGQTGTGKSHTMQGRDDPPELRGITPSAFNYVFQQISSVGEYLSPLKSTSNQELRRVSDEVNQRLKTEDKFQYMVRASYIEIYNEEIRDLVSWVGPK